MSAQPNSGDRSDVPAQPPRDIVEDGRSQYGSLLSKLKATRLKLTTTEKVAKFWRSQHEILRQVSIKKTKTQDELKKTIDNLTKRIKDLEKEHKELRVENSQLRIERNRLRRQRIELEERLCALAATF
ncbi:hypothetical protein AU210_010089 [Fusarium oxysporum f. sp. radicis-cucumerinum]|uniref:Uncharacterized protein n=1 Tax=Fusarium oxysporum f. sp. radicis-cucumerinum TaxID=327505 RepID=A0A2H3GI15_FUSOX|nr:hypothetical protein AU210_010089 [Fusarium oxysporum f. sp. radicis-cucumerinum]